MSVEQDRVFTPETLDRYMRASAETRHVLSESPRCEMIIDPRASRLVLRTPDAGSYPDVGAYGRLAFEVIEEPGEAGVWAELAVDANGMAYEAYSLIMSVVDQLEAGRPLSYALDESLATFKELLTKRRKLSDEQEVGLFGELGLFAHLVAELGEEAATRAWLGPENEEHDFVLPGYDAEVKTTRTEARVHVIGGLGQLAPSPGRAMFLVSVQVTAAGTAAEGETLPKRVNRVRSMLVRSVRVFDERLRSLGWDPRTAEDLYTRAYLARTEPRAYLVDEDFPAITHEGIAAIVRRPELVVGAVYRIDVTGIEPSEPPTEIAGFCERSSNDS
ncbi:PD-(D/E)XK motif protein [Leucobacter soli]|uniref:PD-(D/E)XK motif protein n=1 Tax=Leucobacter soli TaxID=2812850 RepID=A0A916NHK7_9MICO|nr:PD-(D/E)XK motif protein [Leucobacter soli]CAG7614913.1 hypothetical protein LEUCIP111803_01831 [Leucobacter soli]